MDPVWAFRRRRGITADTLAVVQVHDINTIPVEDRKCKICFDDLISSHVVGFEEGKAAVRMLHWCGQVFVS